MDEQSANLNAKRNKEKSQIQVLMKTSPLSLTQRQKRSLPLQETFLKPWTMKSSQTSLWSLEIRKYLHIE